MNMVNLPSPLRTTLEVLRQSYANGKTLNKNEWVFCLLEDYNDFFQIVDQYGNNVILKNQKYNSIIVDINYLIPTNLLGILRIPISLN